MNLISARRCTIRISIFLLFIALAASFVVNILKNAFCYNIHLNSVILLSFLIGVGFVYYGVHLFSAEFKYFTSKEKPANRKLRFLSPIYNYLSNEKLISQDKIQVILCAIEKKVDNYCSLSKYISGSLIFLGLLGTFWGLSHTIGNVANIIDNLGIDAVDASESFAKLKESLKIPLSGMGIAFGCSLFGLSSSLILGFLNINQKKVADDFVDNVEEYLIKHSIIFNPKEQDQNYHGPIFSMALLEKTIETIYAFQLQLKESETNRVAVLNLQSDFSKKLAQLVEATSKHQELVQTIAENQLAIQKKDLAHKNSEMVVSDILKKLTEIDNSLNNMIRGDFVNREYIVDNLGKEIRLISKTLSSLARDE